jgi:hypothetical protein
VRSVLSLSFVVALRRARGLGLDAVGARRFRLRVGHVAEAPSARFAVVVALPVRITSNKHSKIENINEKRDEDINVVKKSGK